MSLGKVPNDQLIQMENVIFEKWNKTGEVFSLTDYSEIIRELTIREKT